MEFWHEKVRRGAISVTMQASLLAPVDDPDRPEEVARLSRVAAQFVTQLTVAGVERCERPSLPGLTQLTQAELLRSIKTTRPFATWRFIAFIQNSTMRTVPLWLSEGLFSVLPGANYGELLDDFWCFKTVLDSESMALTQTWTDDLQALLKSKAVAELAAVKLNMHLQHGRDEKRVLLSGVVTDLFEHDHGGGLCVLVSGTVEDVSVAYALALNAERLAVEKVYADRANNINNHRSKNLHFVLGLQISHMRCASERGEDIQPHLRLIEETNCQLGIVAQAARCLTGGDMRLGPQDIRPFISSIFLSDVSPQIVMDHPFSHEIQAASFFNSAHEDAGSGVYFLLIDVYLNVKKHGDAAKPVYINIAPSGFTISNTIATKPAGSTVRHTDGGSGLVLMRAQAELGGLSVTHSSANGVFTYTVGVEVVPEESVLHVSVPESPRRIDAERALIWVDDQRLIVRGIVASCKNKSLKVDFWEVYESAAAFMSALPTFLQTHFDKNVFVIMDETLDGDNTGSELRKRMLQEITLAVRAKNVTFVCVTGEEDFTDPTGLCSAVFCKGGVKMMDEINALISS